MATWSFLNSTTSTSNTTSYASTSFTPTAGTLLVVGVYASGTVATDTTLTASANGLTFTKITQYLGATSANLLTIFVANQMVPASPAAMTVTFTCTSDAATGAALSICAITGMTKTGAAAVLQQIGANNNVAAAATPTVTFASAPLTANPIIALVGNSSSPATLTPPTNYTERSDAGYSTPTTGLEVATLDSGQTATAVTWGSTSATVGVAMALEFDTSSSQTISPTGIALPSGVSAANATLLGSWDFGVAADGATSVTSVDGSSKVATLSGGAVVGAGHDGGKAAVFNAATQRVDFGRTGLEPNNGYTVMAWFYLPATTIDQYVGVICKARAVGSTRAGIQAHARNGSGAGFYMIRWADTRLVYSDTANVTEPGWHHMCVIDAPDRYGVYLDGTQTVNTTGLADTTTGVWEAFNWFAGYENGLTDSVNGVLVADVRIFQGYLSSAEVATFMGQAPSVDVVTAGPGAPSITTSQPATPQTVSPTAVASVETFGTQVASLPSTPQTASPTGIVSTEAFGTPTPPSQYKYIYGASANGRYLIDQNGNPILLKGDTIWTFLVYAGSYGRSWQSEMTYYANTRGSQGFNAIHTGALSQGHYGPGGTTNYNTWDGVSPWSGSIGTLNNTYWQRMDWLIDECARNGITVIIDLCYIDDIQQSGGGALYGATATELQNYGSNIASRYLGKSNVCYSIGGDWYGEYNTQAGNIFTGVRNAGENRLFVVENYAETTSRYNLEGVTEPTGTWAQANWVYTYDATYRMVEKAWQEASAIPAVWGDGTYDQGTGMRKLMRNQFGWSVTSGGVGGHCLGTEATWQWSSGAYAALTTANGNGQDLPMMRSIIENQTGWHDLVPDINSAWITAGRGTKSTYVTASGGSGGAYDTADTPSTYVTGAKNAAGTLAIIYMPDASQVITVNTAALAAGITAKWIDPVNGTSTTTTAGSTYSTTATNAAGDKDFFLVLTGSSAQTVTPTGVASAETFGTAAISPGATTSSPAGIGTPAALGTPVLGAIVGLQTASIPSGETFGTAATSPTITATATGVATGEVFGTVSTGGVNAVSVTGIISAETFGTNTVTTVISALATGITSAQVFGTSVVTGIITCSPTAIASAQAFGTPAANTVITATATGIASAGAYGAATVTTISVATPTGIVTALVFGNTSTSSVIILQPTGLASLNLTGIPVVTGGGVVASSQNTGWGIPI